MAFSAEQLTQLNLIIGESIRRGLAEGLAAAPAPAPTPQPAKDASDDRRVLDEKIFKRLESFTGDEKGWKDWSRKFKVIVGTKSKDFMRALEKSETMPEATTTTLVGLEDDFVNFEQKVMEKLSAEVYDVLFLSTSSEALALVQSVPDMDGLAAWQKLHRNYNPRTLARVMQRIMAVVTPPRIGDVKTLVTMVEEWEKRIKELETDTSEKITDVFKMAILTAMMPENIQEYISQQTDVVASYKKTKDKVVALANNRVTMQQGPVPMDIGQVGKSQSGSWEDQGAQYYEHEIDYASANTKCHRCGGFGHLARECATEAKGGQKGGGKGDWQKGGGKGQWSKGKGKDAQPTPKGKGKSKGYQGACWKCGKTRHKSAECWNAKAFSVEEGESEEPIEDIEAQEGNVESFWLVAGVDKKIVQPVGPQKTAGVVLKNKFQELADDFEVNNAEVRKCGMVFHLTDAKRMLASVAKIVESGHRVNFSKKPSECFIEHVTTGHRIYMQKENEVFVIKVWVQAGAKKKKATIVIDSGASECVMPKAWLEELPMMKPTPGIRFTCAKGNDLGNYGRKLIEFKPIFTRPAEA